MVGGRRFFVRAEAQRRRGVARAARISRASGSSLRGGQKDEGLAARDGGSYRLLSAPLRLRANLFFFFFFFFFFSRAEPFNRGDKHAIAR